MHAIVHPADVQDRERILLLLATLYGLYPFLRKLFADGGYQGPVFAKGRRQTVQEARCRNRQALGHGDRMCARAQTLDRRAHHRLAQPLPPPGQRLGK